MRAATLSLLGVMALLTGCGGTAGSGDPPPRAQPAIQAAPGGKQAPAPLSQVGAARVIDRPAVQNDLRQLAIFYKTCETDLGKVRSVEAFKNYIKRDAPQLAKALDDNVYGIVPNARPASDVVVAYEKKADAAGQHLVAMGDATVRTLSSVQLQAVLK